MEEHKAGDTVLVYQKPLTQEDFEGEAILIRLLIPRDPNNELEYWRVQFKETNIGVFYDRWIWGKNSKLKGMMSCLLCTAFAGTDKRGLAKLNLQREVMLKIFHDYYPESKEWFKDLEEKLKKEEKPNAKRPKQIP